MFTSVGKRLKGNTSEYQVIEEIARGGMGAILKATDLKDSKIVAIKEACLDPAECEGKLIEIRKRLLEEMAALRPLDHPNIPKIFDQFSSKNNEFLVMEFIEGQTLLNIQRHRLEQSALLEESRVLGWTIQVLSTLEYLHTLDKPIIHRDIKPENLILSHDGRVMLVDFGLMKQIEGQLDVSGPLIKAIGTVEYAPIEQYSDSGSSTDARSDIYSLGATLFYLLAGELPPRAIDRIMPASVNSYTQLPSLRKYNPTVSPQFERVIHKAMEVDPEQRFQSAEQMRIAICPRQRFISLPF
jgi:serine/threonine protein kinase